VTPARLHLYHSSTPSIECLSVRAVLLTNFALITLPLPIGSFIVLFAAAFLSSMAPAMSRVAPISPGQRTRSARVLLIPFDGTSLVSLLFSFPQSDVLGTWANRLGDAHATVVSEFHSLIAIAENVDNGYREGVGTRGGPIEKACSGEKVISGSSEGMLNEYRRSGDWSCRESPRCFW
jgi:hypothetical protein